MKILNLYAGIGGNRKLWGDEHDITAVEYDPETAEVYKQYFPNDKVIVADAHEYLLKHYQEYDFIWSSPPCPTHSRMRKTNTGVGERKSKATYPNMNLYEEILLLEHFFKGKYCVENVIPFYEPLISAKKRGRHLYWTNFNLPNKIGRKKVDNFSKTDIESLSNYHDYNFRKYKGKQRTDKIARNLVDYQAGRIIFETMLGIVKEDTEQITLKL